jgi:Rad3-related DNA helicase
MRTFLNDDGYDFLLIASGDVGFDFSTNDITVQFIVKVPYPALDEEWRGYAGRFGKPEMNAKYTEQTIHTIEQICGRTCRGEDDVGVTFILDSKFEDLYKKNEEMFSEKFKERMVWIK